jgi:hypothetical protein
MLDWLCSQACHCTVGERKGCSFYQKLIDRKDATAGASVSFDQLPAGKKAEIYGVRYAVFETPSMGQLLVTRYGWPWIEALLPDAWYDGGLFWKKGRRLDQSTGMVYHFDSTLCNGREVPLVVKVSRFAQDVPFYATDTFVKHVPLSVLDGMRFANPFEEFGHLIRLRESRLGPRIHTKRPLAIYSPPQKHPLWELGRDASAAAVERYDVAHKQDAHLAHIDLLPDRAYFTLFGWIRGQDVSTLARNGQISREDMEQAARETTADLLEHGMAVLDHKPAHIIVRPDPVTGALRRWKDGRLVYAMVDFELLVDIPRQPRSAAKTAAQ